MPEKFMVNSKIILTGYHSRNKIKASVDVWKGIKLRMYTFLFYAELDILRWTAQWMQMSVWSVLLPYSQNRKLNPKLSEDSHLSFSHKKIIIENITRIIAFLWWFSVLLIGTKNRYGDTRNLHRKWTFCHGKDFWEFQQYP